jgi:hypothetical protein
MKGQNHEDLKRHALILLKNLPQESTVNVISFGSAFEQCFPGNLPLSATQLNSSARTLPNPSQSTCSGPVPCSPENIEAAVQYVRTQGASYGGTNLLVVLQAIVNTTFDLPTNVFLFSGLCSLFSFLFSCCCCW